jgi:COP9 signalosome complex subunit 5
LGCTAGKHSLSPHPPPHRSYYQLPVEYFKSSADTHLLDVLWSTYWRDTLSSNPLVHNIEFASKALKDSVNMLREHVKVHCGAAKKIDPFVQKYKGKTSSPKQQQQVVELSECTLSLEKVSQELNAVAVERMKALMVSIVKRSLFKCSCGDGQAMDLGA